MLLVWAGRGRGLLWWPVALAPAALAVIVPAVWGEPVGLRYLSLLVGAFAAGVDRDGRGGGAEAGVRAVASLASAVALRRGRALVGAAAAAPGCAFPPWSMGAPLDGRPSIPATTEAPSIPSLRALAVAQRAAGHTALELKALAAIARAERLKADERERVVALLEQRARELLALGRAVPACDDLRELEELAPARARALAALHAAAERDAGDAWLAVGDRTPRARGLRDRGVAGRRRHRLSAGRRRRAAGARRARASPSARCWSCRCARCRRSPRSISTAAPPRA